MIAERMVGPAIPRHPHPHREAGRRLFLAGADLAVLVGGCVLACLSTGRCSPLVVCALAPMAVWISVRTIAPPGNRLRLISTGASALHGVALTAWLALLLFLDGASPALLKAGLCWGLAAIVWMAASRWLTAGRASAIRLVTAGRSAGIDSALLEMRLRGHRVVEVARLSWEGPPDEAQIADLVAQTREGIPDAVLLCATRSDQSTWQALLHAMQRVPIPIHATPALEDWPVFLPGTESVGGIGTIRLVGTHPGVGRILAKLVFDKILALVVVVGLSWLLLTIALLVVATSKGPAFYVQRRHGIGGRCIPVLKFRTMAARPGTRDPSGVFRQAEPDDPRVTWLGRLLRNTSLDELPQFFNVLLGDMSVVGPRPHAVLHNESFLSMVPDLMRRHLVKPGITGLAQIGGARGETRTALQMQRRISLDLDYIRRGSLWLDLRLVIATAFTGFYNHHP